LPFFFGSSIPAPSGWRACPSGGPLGAAMVFFFWCVWLAREARAGGESRGPQTSRSVARLSPSFFPKEYFFTRPSALPPAYVPDVQRLGPLDITRRVNRFGHLGCRSGSVPPHCLCPYFSLSLSLHTSSYEMWLWLKLARLQVNIAGRDPKVASDSGFIFLDPSR
jgi:hypothetical protein